MWVDVANNELNKNREQNFRIVPCGDDVCHQIHDHILMVPSYHAFTLLPRPNVIVVWLVTSDSPTSARLYLIHANHRDQRPLNQHFASGFTGHNCRVAFFKFWTVTDTSADNVSTWIADENIFRQSGHCLPCSSRDTTQRATKWLVVSDVSFFRNKFRFYPRIFSFVGVVV